MAYKSDGVAMTKLQYASYLAASLAYLMAFQHDAAGLITFDTKERDQVPPRQGPGHLRVLMNLLEKTQPGGESSLVETFHRLAASIKRKSLIIVLSDLFDDAEKLLGALKHFRHARHEVIVLQVLDPAEVTFPFDDVTRIEDMENAREVTSDPRAFRNAYLEEFGKFIETLRGGCRSAGIDYVTAQTDQRFDLFLGNYLARRQAMMA
jgi:uncharacterized protein (DUF58 family)